MTQSIRLFTAACALGLSSVFAAVADDAAAAPRDGQRFVRSLTFKGDRLTLPHCKTSDGITVRYVIFDEDPEGSPYAYKIKAGQQDIIDEMRAEGLPHQPGAYIVLNKSFLASAPPETRRHIIAHECAHHVLGHTLRPPLTLRQAQRAEIEADCAAVKIMSRHFGMTRHGILRALDFFKTPLFAGDAHAIHGNGPTRYNRGVACMLK